ncbi:hypothetical protein BU23DRAFT_92364 [Bimuria novae-zelandiae CBS 107.79]|uniref:Uncharacterized protein n=1 Tax=Bimuria novae-zelandiae CBS 107.79 TaxID=1447943 RepID=A0A6A5VIM1_9PLEO|nr:hypothetical protein BU23DRAFT_92364 [Bimuria novae-zelandiae CBS 107.79]
MHCKNSRAVVDVVSQLGPAGRVPCRIASQKLNCAERAERSACCQAAFTHRLHRLAQVAVLLLSCAGRGRGPRQLTVQADKKGCSRVSVLSRPRMQSSAPGVLAFWPGLWLGCRCRAEQTRCFDGGQAASLLAGVARVALGLTEALRSSTRAEQRDASNWC